MSFQMFSKYYIFHKDLEIVWILFQEKHENEDW